LSRKIAAFCIGARSNLFRRSFRLASGGEFGFDFYGVSAVAQGG